MPVPAALEGNNLAQRMRRLRENPFTAYGIALAAVTFATIIRWAIGDYVLGRVPFTLYFPAIVLATLLGGIWPGVLATILSSLVAWFVFLRPTFDLAFTWSDGASLLTFILVALMLVGVVTALNLAIDRLANEIEQRRHMQLAERQLGAIVETSDDAIIAKDLNGIITSWNRGAEHLFGYTADEVIGKPVSLLIPPDRHDEEPTILERLRRGERIDHYETVRQSKDGSLVDISLTVSPVKDAKGKVIGTSKIARDISERKRAAEQQEMLVREMRHRIKNAFAVVSGIVRLTALSAATPEEMSCQVRERLAALSRAHDLTHPGLLEPESRTSPPMTFHALVRAIFSPYLDSDASTERMPVIIRGPDVPIGEHAVTGMALVLHELATNAIKCGALSSINGSVHIEVSVADGQFQMAWQEKGGPQLNGSPQQEGFGSLLTRRIVTGQFGGEISYDWKSQGLAVHLSAPLERLGAVEG
jgi:PAS domain S-box-containing protein